MQGIEYLGNDLFIENSGWYGESETSYTHLENGVLKTQSTMPMDKSYFGEGICSLPPNQKGEITRFLRMTWKENVMEVLNSDLTIIEKREMFEGPTQGWGITRNGNTLYVSDGSHTIFKFDADTFEPIGSFVATLANGNRVSMLNELQFVNGLIWANVFTTDWIVAIEPDVGTIRHHIDC